MCIELDNFICKSKKELLHLDDINLANFVGIWLHIMSKFCSNIKANIENISLKESKINELWLDYFLLNHADYLGDESP